MTDDTGVIPGPRARHPVRPEEARTRLIQAALRCMQAEMADEHAHAADEYQYADELLALAARDLARAMDSLPPHQQPVGWVEGSGVDH
jgi:hypothetical protein